MKIKNESDILRNTVSVINHNVKGTGINLRININHVLNRLRDRDISIIDINRMLHKLSSERLCEFVYATYLPDNNKPMQIELRSDNCILMLGRQDDLVWVIRTVLDPSIHNKHQDELPNKWQYTIKL
jgi:hypothetical protein